MNESLTNITSIPTKGEVVFILGFDTARGKDSELRRATVLGQYLSHSNIIRLQYHDTGKEDTIIVKHPDGLNPRIFKQKPATACSYCNGEGIDVHVINGIHGRQFPCPECSMPAKATGATP